MNQVSLTIKWFGAERLTRKLLRAVALMPKLTQAAVVEEAKSVLADTLPITPSVSGRLRATGRVVEVSHSRFETTYAVTFGGMVVDGVFVDYALPVHENLTARHAPPTQAKFLETTINNHAAMMSRRMGLKTAAILRIL